MDQSTKAGDSEKVGPERDEPEKAEKRQYHYGDLLAITIHVLEPSQLDNPEIERILVAFRDNVERLYSIIHLPIAVTAVGMHLTEQTHLGLALAAGGFPWTFLHLSPSEFKEKLGALPPEATIKYHAARLAKAKQGFGQTREHALELIEDAASNVEPVSVGMDGLFASAIITMWTAFESMATDLWETALNIHPHILAELKQKKAGIKDLEKSVTLNTLQRFGFDLSNRMGTLLKHKMNFGVLKGIKEAYLSAFPDEGGDLDSVFGDKSIVVLSAVRNVLVHRAGIVDEKFARIVSDDPSFQAYRTGEKLKLDGKIVRSLLQLVCIQVSKLLIVVDQWIAQNPNKLRKS